VQRTQVAPGMELLPGASMRPPDTASPSGVGNRGQSYQPHQAISDLGNDYCQELLADIGGGKIVSMGHDRTQQATPDLFSTAWSGEPSPPPRAKQSSAQKRRHVLPNDLPNAVKHLDDRELDLLITASLEEAKRRGRLLPGVQANTPDQSVQKRSPTTDKSSHRRQVGPAPVSLTRGQLNAVRAAAKAGIKPSVIARQFGISQSDVRKVLASDTTTLGGA
jgi:hypothetical protein